MATGYWRGADNANWLTTTNWWTTIGGVMTVTTAPGAGDTAFFNANGTTTARTVYLNGSRSVGTFWMNGNAQGDITLRGGVSGSEVTQTLTLGGIDMSGTSANSVWASSINVALSNNNFWNIGSGRAILVNGVVSGAFKLTSNNAGVIIFGNANTYSGGTDITAGTVRAGNNQALGTGTITMTGGKLSSSSTTGYSLTNALTLNGTMTLGDATNTGNLTFSGTTNVAGPTTLTNGGSAITLSGQMTGSASASLSVSSVAGINAFAITGTGNTYFGAFSLTAGAARVGSSSGPTNQLASAASIALSGGTVLWHTGTTNTTISVPYTGPSNSEITVWRDGILTFAGSALANFNGPVTHYREGGSGAASTIEFSTNTAFPTTGGFKFLAFTSVASTLTVRYTGTGNVSNSGTIPIISDTTGSLVTIDNSGGSGSNLTLSGTIQNLSSLTTTTNLALAGTSTGTTTLSGNITDSATSTTNLSKTSSGTLTLSGSTSTYKGTVSVTSGTLNANSATALGVASSTAGISVTSGATLSLGGASNITYTAPRTLTLAGTGVGGTTGALVIANAVTNTFSGIALTAGTLIRASESGTLTAPVTTNSHNLTFTVAAGKTLTLPSTSVISASTTTVSYNTVSGDTGTAVVSAQNLYTNPTVIGQGTVRVGASSVGSPGSVTSGPLGRGQLTWNGGALDASTTATLGNNVVLGGDVSFGGTAALTLAGTVSLGASRIITTNGSGGALTLSGVVSGTGFSLTKAGTNTLILSSANTYTGGTTIRAGTVVASNADALGTSGTITLNDASTGTSAAELKINASAGTVTLARPIVVANQGTGTTTLGSATTSGTSIARFSGAVTLAKSVTLDGGSAGDRLEFLGGISGTGNVTVAGTNRVIFMTVANTYAGTTTINSGAILQLSDGTATATSLLPSTQSVTVNGILRLAKGANSQTIDALNGSGTVSQIVLGAATLVVGNSNGSGTFSGALTDSFGGPLGLTKLGTGTQTLTGTSTYTGPTTISGGTLSFANGSLGATSSITINGGTLQWAAGNTQDISVPVFLQNGGSAIFDTNGNNASLSGEIAGSTSSSFTKTGVGTLSLQGGSSFNWTGNTTVSVGKLVVAGSAYFLGSGSISIAAGTEFSFATSQNITLSGPISGAGALTKSSTGTLTLSSSTASSYTGPVTISEGRLDANLLSPLGSNASTQPITVSSGATLSLGAVGNTANSRVLYLAGTGVTATTGALILNTTGTVSFSRFDLTGATLIRATESSVVNNGITSNNNDLTISVASGTTLRMTSVAVIGASTTSVSYHTVSGDTGTVLVQAKHLYTGTTTINQGTISVNTGSLGSPGSITSGPFGRGQINWNGGAFATEVGQTPTVGNDIVVGGDVSFKGPEVLTLSGPVLLSASRTITTDGTGNQLEISGTISGAGSKLTKAGSRTIRLTAANTYDGGTDIVAGVVETGNTQALGTAGTVTLRAGARLRTRIAGGVNGKLTVAALDNSEGGVIQIGSF